MVYWQVVGWMQTHSGSSDSSRTGSSGCFASSFADSFAFGRGSNSFVETFADGP